MTFSMGERGWRTGVLVRPRISAALASLLAVAGALYLIALCFINTRVAGISNAVVAASDAAIVLAAFGLAFVKHGRTLVIFALALLSFFLLQRLATPELAIKPVRDVMLPAAFFFLGKSYADAQSANRVFWSVAIAVIVFGAWEYFSAASYTEFFNIRNFFVARGVTDPETIGSGDLFASGMRPFDRVIIPALGQHRVSSIFLEPVSMGNFGAIALAWGMSRTRVSWRITAPVIAIGVLAIVMADARFALGAAVLFLLARMAPLRIAHAIAMVAPLLALLIVLAMGAIADPQGDTIASRLAQSGQAVASLSFMELIGLGADGDYETQDSGYYYVLKSFGLAGAALLWLGFMWLRAPNADALRFKTFLALYIAALLCVSSASLFALKTAGLVWFLFGALSAAEHEAQKP
jgi:putative polymerase